MNKIKLFFIGLFFSVQGSAQTWNWATSVNYTCHITAPTLITSDVNGNVFSAGYKKSGPGVFLRKYSAEGTLLWDTVFADYGSLSSISTDTAGNSYMAFFQVHLSGTTYYPEDGNFLIKFSPAGNVIWQKRPGMGIFMAERIKSDNKIKMTGGYSNSCVLENGYSLNYPGNYFLATYNTNGDCIWAQENDGGRYPVIYNQNKEMFVAGEVDWGTTVGQGSTQLTLNPSDGEMYLAKYDSLGNLIWVSQELSCQATMDDFGYAYSLFPSPTNYRHMYLRKFSETGNQSWERTHLYSPSWQKFKMACDQTGNIFITGGFSNSLTIDDTTITVSGSEAFVAKLDSAGTLQWVTVTSDSGSAGAKDISIGDDGAIYITGDMSGTVCFGPHCTTQSSGVFVAKLMDADITGVEENSLSNVNLNISPNPGSGIFNLSYTADDASKLRVEVHNSTGQMVWSQNEQNSSKSFSRTIDLSSQPKGIYFVQVTGERTRVVRKIIKN